MKYAFINQHRDEFSVLKMVEILGVSRGGYYRWRHEPISKREQADMDLTEQIESVFKASGETYGSPRVYLDLKEDNIVCGRTRIERLMKEHGLIAKAARKYKATTDSDHPHPPSPDLVNRNFTADEPDKLWVSDITYIHTDEGWLYLCTVIDLFSRRVVGWTQSKRMKADMVVRAIQMAVDAHHPKAGIIFHSDRGSQYVSRRII